MLLLLKRPRYPEPLAAAKPPRGSQLVESETHVVVVRGAGVDLGEHVEAAVWVVEVFLK